MTYIRMQQNNIVDMWKTVLAYQTTVGWTASIQGFLHQSWCEEQEQYGVNSSTALHRGQWIVSLIHALISYT